MKQNQQNIEQPKKPTTAAVNKTSVVAIYTAQHNASSLNRIKNHPI